MEDHRGGRELEARLAAVEARLGVVEDELEILRLLASYGPLVDSGAARAAAELWRAGGGYDFGHEAGSTRVAAPEGLRALYESEIHRDLVAAGSSHLTAMPRIVIRGDEAEAVGYSFVIVNRDGRWHVHRAAINHWLLLRTPGGWRIDERFNRVLDGSAESHDVMRRVLR